MKLYVGNLSYNASDDTLREIFGVYGEVASTAVIKDRETGRSKGFGFVEYSNDDEARDAISALDGKEVGGRVIKVNEARPRDFSNGPSRSFGDERRGGGGERRGGEWR